MRDSLEDSIILVKLIVSIEKKERYDAQNAKSFPKKTIIHRSALFNTNPMV
jgi:hypothetical protein